MYDTVLAFCWDIFDIAPKVAAEYCRSQHFLTQKPYALPLRSIKSQKKATVWPQAAVVRDLRYAVGFRSSQIGRTKTKTFLFNLFLFVNGSTGLCFTTMTKLGCVIQMVLFDFITKNESLKCIPKLSNLAFGTVKS